MKARCFAICLLMSSLPLSASTENPDFPADLASQWRPDIYIPVTVWHNRLTWDRAHILRYNERPGGAGLGVSRINPKGNWEGWYGMIFRDSFSRWEPIVGYGWEARWPLLDNTPLSVGAGFTAGITARDNYNYIPLPLVLPLASISYGPVSAQMTYIPGGYNSGNVLFAWARWHF